MKMIMYRNDNKHAVHIAGKTIMPNAPREIPEIDHPDYQRPDAAPEVETDALAALSEGKADDILAAVPGLTDDDLDRLTALEHERDKGPRKTVTEAIAAEQLQRAQAAADAEAESAVD